MLLWQIFEIASVYWKNLEKEKPGIEKEAGFFMELNCSRRLFFRFVFR
jgi:hypothetical protein